VEPTGNTIVLAEHYLDVGQPQRALDLLSRASADDAAVVATLRARALLDLERNQEAAETARQALAEEPDDPEILMLLALAEWKLDNHAEAERAVLAALELTPDEPALLCVYAHVVASAGQLDKAERLAERAASVDPENAYVARTRAEIAYLQGRDADVQRHGHDALALEADDPQTHAILGATDAERGRARLAERHLRTSAELDPSVEHYAEAARAVAVATHPLMLPLWPIQRFGQGPVWIAGVVTLLVGTRVAPGPVAGALIVLWLLFVAYSWIAPPLVERWVARRHP
jgi:tetratricopeptide (TPR) repeat protein